MTTATDIDHLARNNQLVRGELPAARPRHHGRWLFAMFLAPVSSLFGGYALQLVLWLVLQRAVFSWLHSVFLDVRFQVAHLLYRNALHTL